MRVGGAAQGVFLADDHAHLFERTAAISSRTSAVMPASGCNQPAERAQW